MKFCKRYQQYMEGREKEFPIVNLKKMKKTLKSCRSICGSQSSNHEQDLVQGAKEKGVLVRHGGAVKSCPDQCQVCDGTFFPTLLKEMSSVVGCFNKRAQELLKLHFSSGFRKYIMWIKGNTRHHHKSLIQEGKDLVAYAIINSIAMRKILKKYDKIHYSKQGQTFRSQAQIMHIEILHSPWLCELMALYINNKEGKDIPGTIPGLFEDCKLDFDVGKPVLSCGLFDSLKLNIDLTCSICLDTVFDPISLSCGHLFCYICACSAASVTIVDGLKSADPKAKCPLCRQTEVFNGYVRLAELSILLSQKCPEYWEKRLQDERIDRIRQAKEHWESQCRALLGI